MAIANAFGSNIFDILLCLGLPWTIQTAILKKKVMVEYEEFKATFFILVGLYLFFILVLMISYSRTGLLFSAERLGGCSWPVILLMYHSVFISHWYYKKIVVVLIVLIIVY